MKMLSLTILPYFFCIAGEVLKPGAYVTLRNAKVEMFRGNMRLAVDKFGKIEPAEGSSFTPKVILSVIVY